MAPLTWRNVDAPNFSGAAAALEVSGRSFNNAATGLTDAVDSFQEGRTQAASTQLMSDIMKNRTPDELNKALASGILGSMDPRYITPEALKFAADWGNQLSTDALNRQKLGLLAARGGGGGRGGRGSKDDFVDVNGAGIRGYIDENGNITSTPVTSGAPTTQDLRVSQLPGDIVGEVAAAADPTLMTSELPVSESEAGAPVSMAQIAPTLENAAALPGAVATTDPATALVTSLRPTPGPIRIGTPKGKDGLNQRNSELVADLAAGRLTSFEGNPQEAIAAWGLNPRIRDNATATNALDGIKNEIETAKAGQAFREGEFKERDLQRKEDDEVRGRASTEIARVAADEALVTSIDAQDAKVKLAQLLNSGDLEVDAFRKAVARVDENAESLAIFNDPTAQEATTPVVGSGDQPVDPNAKPAEGKGDAKATTPAATAPRRDPLAGTVLERQFQQFNDQINLDQSGDLNAEFRAGFNDASNSKETVSDVANRAVGKGGAFEGGNKEDYLNTVNDVMERYKVKPAVAALMIESTQAGRSRLYRAFWGDLNPLEGSINLNEERLDELGKLITDPETGRVRAELLQENEARRESNAVQNDIKTKYDAAGKAQAALNKAIGLAAQGRNPEKIKLKELEAKAKTTADAVSQAIAEATRRGGAATANRGDFEDPQTAETPANVFPNRGPAPGVIPQEVTARATAIYQRLRDQMNREPSRREDLDLRRQARELAISQVNSATASDLLARAARGN